MRPRYQLVRLEAAIYEAPEAPQEPPARGDYTPEQVLAALQNWGDLEELRARGRMPTLLQCVYLDVLTAYAKVSDYDRYFLDAMAGGNDWGGPDVWNCALRLCALMNGPAYVG